jgi:hypothetical protein
MVAVIVAVTRWGRAGPGAAHAHQHKDMPRRDPVKVAEHFSAGMMSQRRVPLGGTIDTIPYCSQDARFPADCIEARHTGSLQKAGRLLNELALGS